MIFTLIQKNSALIFKLLEGFVNNQIKAGKAKFDAACKQ